MIHNIYNTNDSKQGYEKVCAYLIFYDLEYIYIFRSYGLLYHILEKNSW